MLTVACGKPHIVFGAIGYSALKKLHLKLPSVRKIWNENRLMTKRKVSYSNGIPHTS
jgi:hypothetical protein